MEYLSILRNDYPDEIVVSYNPFMITVAYFILFIYLLLISYPYYILFKYLFHKRIFIIISLILFYLVFFTSLSLYSNDYSSWEEYFTITLTYLFTLSFLLTIFFIIYNSILRNLKKPYFGSIKYLFINILLLYIGYAILQTRIN